MIIKYRVHEVAKDLGVPSKDIIEFLGHYYEQPHKHMTALTEEELNLIFEHYTKEKEVESFDAYFASAKKAEPKKPAEGEPDLENTAKKEYPKQQGVNAQGNKPAGQQPHREGTKPGEHVKQNRFQQQPRPAAKKPQQHSQPRPQPQAQQLLQHAHPFSQKSSPIVPQRALRHVNTRGVQVDLDKYNTHYDEMTPDRARRDNIQHGKQKIHQRSANRRPMGAKRETESERLKRLAHEKGKKTQLKITVPDEISVGELASRLKVTASDLIKKLMAMGVMASVSQTVDYDTAVLAAMEFNVKVEKEVVVTIEDKLIDDSEDEEKNLQPRSPVVVVMGHVDHGKTSLLDAIRHTNVAEGEAGGITQRIGAYRVKIKDKYITFLDTPGHEAFTAMRARGAQVTDIAVLVVAADDGIMPQTIEAINHAKAAKVSIIVAINKIDKPGADPDKVKQALTEYGLVAEEWGGDTICVPVSAVKHQNIDKLLEMIELVAEMKNLRANPGRAAKGTVIEARLDKGRGVIATLLVQNGTLHIGDVLIAGTSVGRVRAMTDENSEQIQDAGPSVPVEITGLSEVPEAGDVFHAVKDERMARELVEQRRTQEKEEQFSSYQKVTLDNLYEQMQEGEIKELNIIVKADVQGSVEAVRQSLEKLSNDQVRVNVIHGGVGAINESDIKLAEASNAIIIGFDVRPDDDARRNAQISGVEMRMYRVIYECIEDVQNAMKGLLEPKTREVQLGRTEVRHVYKISSVGTIAGCYVLEGKVSRNAQIRVVRDGIVITEDTIASLKRFKDDAKEVLQGYECGIGLEKYNDIKEGDIFEAFTVEEYKE